MHQHSLILATCASGKHHHCAFLSSDSKQDVFLKWQYPRIHTKHTQTMPSLILLHAACPVTPATLLPDLLVTLPHPPGHTCSASGHTSRKPPLACPRQQSQAHQQQHSLQIYSGHNSASLARPLKVGMLGVLCWLMCFKSIVIAQHTRPCCAQCVGTAQFAWLGYQARHGPTGVCHQLLYHTCFEHDNMFCVMLCMACHLSCCALAYLPS
jgi:hypothetical protein